MSFGKKINKKEDKMDSILNMLYVGDHLTLDRYSQKESVQIWDPESCCGYGYRQGD